MRPERSESAGMRRTQLQGATTTTGDRTSGWLVRANRDEGRLRNWYVHLFKGVGRAHTQRTTPRTTEDRNATI